MATASSSAGPESSGAWHRRTNSEAERAASGSEEGLYSAPTSYEGPGYAVEVPTVTTRRYAVIMVGLPARGKTFLAQKLSRYLAWLGHESAVFNVQRMWRESLGVQNHRSSGGATTTFPEFSTLGGAGSTATAPVSEPSTMGSPEASTTTPGGASKQQFINSDTFFRAFVAADAQQAAAPSPSAASASSSSSSSYGEAVRHCVSKVQGFFEKGGLVAFLNDDFVTRRSRDELEAQLQGVADQVLYIEVIRDDDSNARFEALKVANCAEYGHLAGSQEATSDFAKRVALLKSVYEHVGDDKSYIRVRNSTHVELRDVRGYLPSRMTSFLMHLSPQNKVFCPIYFSRHGQSEYNLEDRLGGNPRLTDKGHDDARALGKFIATVKEENDAAIARQQEELQSAAAATAAMNASTASGGSLGAAASMSPNGAPSVSTVMKPLQIWTSQLTRTIETARPAEVDLGITCLRWRNLNEIHAGVCEGLTYADVKEQHPAIHDFRKRNKYAFRYPEGESYQDLVARLEPVIMELENADRVVIVVAHQAVLRGLLAYFGGSNAEHSVHVEVPHRTVWRCSYDEAGIPTIDEMKLPPTTAEVTEVHFVPTAMMPSAPGSAAAAVPGTPKAP